jgi:hypothetical protein
MSDLKSARRELARVKAAFEKVVPGRPPLFHALAAVPRDYFTAPVPWRLLCLGRPGMQRPVRTSDPETHGTLRGCFFCKEQDKASVDTDLATVVEDRFSALAVAAVVALHELGVGAMPAGDALQALNPVRRKLVAAGHLVGWVYERAWGQASGLLTAERRRLFSAEIVESVPPGAEHDRSHRGHVVCDPDDPGRVYFSLPFSVCTNPTPEGRAFPHDFYSVLCGGNADVFEASAWALEAILSDAVVPPRLVIDLASSTVTLDGVRHCEIDPGALRALRAYQQLAEQFGEGVNFPAKSVMGKLNCFHAETLNRWIKALPQDLRGLIVGTRGSGRRLRLPPPP